MKAKGGFTLIELLVVIGIIAILAGVVIVAVNPGRQFAQGRDTVRNNDVLAILNAIGQYQADHGGNFNCPTGQSLPTSLTFIGSGAGEYNMHDCIIPTYISQIPLDPIGAPSSTFTSTGSYTTGYRVSYDPTTRRVTVDAPYAEITTPITLTR